MPELIYQNNIANLTKLISDKKNVLNKIMISRVIAFVILCALIGYSIYTNSFSPLWFLVVPIVLFGVFVKLNLKEKTKLQILQKKLQINNEESLCLSGDYNQFENGGEFMDSHHNYSHDIDLFGDYSLFQYLNRTTSNASRKRLAQFLMNFETDKNEIALRQEAVEELSEKLEWRQELRAKGLHFKSDNENLDKLFNWNQSEIPIFKNKVISKLLLWAIPALVIFSIVLTYYSIIPISLLVFIFLIPLLISGRHLKLVNTQHNQIDKFVDILIQQKNLSELIENQDFKSDKLKQIRSKLLKNSVLASERINQLAVIAQQLDNRSNPVFAILMNGLFLWDLQYLYKLKNWLSHNENEIKNWFEAVNEIEAFCSFGNFKFNNPAYVFPEMTQLFSAKNLAHPLIFKNKIANDVSLDEMPSFMIITGANMAGKSTFLRAVAVNLVLAVCGAPVCASEFNFVPTSLFTSMRTSDSLSDNESYFYSELKRLQLIVNKLKNGEKLFIILDEILKGTNSKDKAEGSKNFVKQLLNYQSAGIIATHDLSLCSIKEEFNTEISTYYFDVEIENDQLIFDYKLKPGICSNMNAEFLMKKMGITL